MSEAPVTLRSATQPMVGFSDEELLQRIGWRNSTSDRISRAAADGNLPKFAAALRRDSRFCTKVRRSKRDSSICDAFLRPLWSERCFEDMTSKQSPAPLLKLFAKLPARPDRKDVDRISRRVLKSLDTDGTETHDSPLTLLSWLTILSWGSGSLNDEALVGLWLRALCEVQRIVVDEHDQTDPSLSDDQRILIQGEIPFMAGLVFQEVRGSRSLMQRGKRRLRQELQTGTDNDGTPHSQLLDRFSLWLSPFCRAAIVGRRFNTAWWNRSAAARFADLVQRSAALTRSSGEFALGNGVSLAPVSLLKAASDVAERSRKEPSADFVEAVPNDAALLTRRNPKPAQLTAPGRSTRRRSLAGYGKRANRPASQSDWAQLACLRNNWDLGADACVIAWNDARPRIDLTALGTAVVSGSWGLKSSIDGAPIADDSEWECVCWFSDRDVDYIELRREGDQASVLRQAVLSRTDHFLYLADTFRSSSNTRKVEHGFDLPLAGRARCTRDALSREWLLKIGSLKVRVLPVSLEQDATIPSAGELTIRDDAIHMHQTFSGPGLVSALVLDWSPVRRKEPASWNGLTVAEDGRVVTSSEAAAFHLRLGGHQWLFYRSLVPGQTARTVLGQHTSNEAIIGEMNGDGDLDPLVIVEG